MDNIVLFKIIIDNARPLAIAAVVAGAASSFLLVYLHLIISSAATESRAAKSQKRQLHLHIMLPLLLMTRAYQPYRTTLAVMGALGVCVATHQSPAAVPPAAASAANALCRWQTRNLQRQQSRAAWPCTAGPPPSSAAADTATRSLAACSISSSSATTMALL